ncbi:MAG: complex I subunit 4 family protein [Gammaproteobacteria bacterium]
MGILSLLLWIPALGALLVAWIPGQRGSLIRAVTQVFTVAALLVGARVLALFDADQPGLQLSEFFVLTPAVGSVYSLGIDGLSLPLALMAALLTFCAVQASASIRDGVRGYYFCLLVLEFGMLGVFLAQDWELFYVFWEVTLIPLFFLIGRWGGARRHAASLNFVLYTMGGSIFMLISLIAIGQYALESGGSLMVPLKQAATDMSKTEQILVLLGLIIGFGVKMPIFPLHGWLPLAHVEAPSPISILLSGILLKMGGYGLMRAVAMLPEAAEFCQTGLMILALIGMVYGGLLAWRQTDLKAMVAYSSVSHMGVVLLGIATLNETGMTGAVLQMTAHGFIAAALFLLVGLLYERTHTRNVHDYSSLVQTAPRFAVLTTLALFAAMGLPGTVGFIAELHALIGGFHQWGAWMAFFGLGILLSASYAVRTIGLLFTGPVRSQMRDMRDLTWPEMCTAAILAGGIVGLGVLPQALIELSETTVAGLNAILNTSP